jgi:hypothetical protein
MIPTNLKHLAADFVQMVHVLTKRLHCCIIVLHHIAAKELMAEHSMQQFEKYWNPAVDLRLHFSEKTDTSNRVQVIKARRLVIIVPGLCYFWEFELIIYSSPLDRSIQIHATFSFTKSLSAQNTLLLNSSSYKLYYYFDSL